jgi:hypothetical protein
MIILLLVVSAAAAGAWARQVKGGGDVEVKTIDVLGRFQFEPATISIARDHGFVSALLTVPTASRSKRSG